MDSLRDRDGRLAALTPYDCWNLLDGPRIGRVAWSREGSPGVIPVNVSVFDGALWFRSSPTSNLITEASGQPVSVQIDEIDPSRHTGWSVVVEGIAEVIKDEDVPDMVDTLEVWPSGDRSVHVRVERQKISGRKLMREERAGSV